MSATSNVPRRSLGDMITRWWHSVSRNWAGMRELRGLDSSEIRNLAKDVNCNVSELQTLAGRWPESADLLPQRLNALHLDAQTFLREHPELANDLKKNCSLCAVKGPCEDDLNKRPYSPVWQRYCPNTMTLLAVTKSRSKSPEGGSDPSKDGKSGQ
jgi:hypothetical protein